MEESVTLMTAKNRYRCWKARTRARKTRMCVWICTFWEKEQFRRRDE